MNNRYGMYIGVVTGRAELCFPRVWGNALVIEANSVMCICIVVVFFVSTHFMFQFSFIGSAFELIIIYLVILQLECLFCFQMKN